MKLLRCVLNNFRRFEKTSINLDKNLLAIVGPNESGKSSFFQALLSTKHYEPLSNKELRKGVSFDETDEIVTLEYIIEKKDLEKLIELNGIGKPTRFFRKKTVGGAINTSLSSDVTRNKEARKKAYDLMYKTYNTKKYTKELEGVTYLVDDEDKDSEQGVLVLMSRVVTLLESDVETYSESELGIIEKYYEVFGNPEADIHSFDGVKRMQLIQVLLGEALKAEKLPHPDKKYRDYLSAIRPTILFYDEDQRKLNETYEVSELTEPSPFLKNLLVVAELDGDDLFKAIEDNDSGRQEALLENANNIIKRKYSEYWNQAEVYPKIKLESNQLRILIRFVNTYNNIGDRSDGLKQFISLFAFALNNDHWKDLVLLVDEAENHLHYSAQTEIVELFENQELANSIIYSTHSAGCLPSDLGTGIRVVKPIRDEHGEDTGVSEFRNSIWSNDGGFTPLLFAMGASVIAFSLTRKAIIAEGPSETILLPRIFREAMQIKSLDFQIAPGLATISTERCKEFEFEASKVGYIIDGDGGGEQIKQKLKSGEIKAKYIVSLPKNHSLEDFINPSILVEAINKELKRYDLSSLVVNIKNLGQKSIVNQLKNLCIEQNIVFPSKVRIAEHIANLPSNIRIVNERKVKAIKSVYVKIQKILE